MFVSSYSTFIQTDNLKNQQNKSKKVENGQNSFRLKPKSSVIVNIPENKTLSINYISNYKVLSNKQQIQEQLQNKNTTKTKNTDTKKYKAINTKVNAKTSYDNSAKLFPISRNTHAVLNQNLGVQKDTKSMVNIYIANDEFYKINAA